MNDMTVGMENLPNVFIDKITVERVTGTLDLRIRVILKMFDYADNHSWRNKVDGLKVKCAFVDENQTITGLNSGRLSLYDVNNVTISKVLVQSCDTFRFDNRVAGYETFTSVFQFETNTIPPNLNVYAACFIDDLEFGIPLFDKFYGPMMAERIVVGGVLNEITGYFYNPETNEEYGGPVHQHSSGYMEGSMHRDEPHAGLRYVAEENYKLIQGSDLNDEVFAGMVFEETEFQDIPTPAGDPSAPTAPVLTPNDSSAAEYDAYLQTQTVQQPNFNLVGDPTPIDPPPGY
tara:strand:- start:4804 stop:5670 length:867 start_codon:yes stop_codon:yes gene_type:complete